MLFDGTNVSLMVEMICFLTKLPKKINNLNTHVQPGHRSNLCLDLKTSGQDLWSVDAKWSIAPGSSSSVDRSLVMALCVFVQKT